MNNFIKMAMCLSAAVAAVSCKSDNKDFKYTLDEFADIKVIRYTVPGWDELSFDQKAYAYYLAEAAKYGRDIYWDQNCAGNIQLRHALESILEKYQGDRECEEFGQFTEYAKRVFFSNGIHHHYAEFKFFPACDRNYFKSLLASVDMESEELLEYVYNPDLYPVRRCTDASKDIVTGSAVNFYDGVTRAEVQKYYASIIDPNDPCPIAYGLNTKVVKENGKIVEKPWKSGGIYGAAIDRICTELEKASVHAQSQTQKRQIALLIEYYRTGDLRIWDEFNIEWVKDTSSIVDFVNGFIEDYNDPLAMKGAWEAHVNIKDENASKRTELIAGNAQWFEDNAPIDPRFRKPVVKGVSAKVINAVCLSGDTYPSTPIGINLPNANWIRRDYGSKSVTISNITNAYDYSAQESPKSTLNEFAWDEEEIALCKKFGAIASEVHTDLHECLGHGSGQLLPGVSDSAMGEYSATLEEARADLFGLYYAADPKLVELGVLPDKDAYKAEYCTFIRNGLMVQFNRVEFGRTNTEPHMQDRKLIAEWCYENGNGAIGRRQKDGKTYFVITDYDALRATFGRMLAEIQRIKSEGDYEAGKALVERYAVNIDPLIHKEVLKRYASLGLKPYGGFLNPDIVPVEKNGRTVDYKLVYPTDFLQQMLGYGKKYGVL